MEIWPGLGSEFWVVKNTPLPRKWKFGQDLGVSMGGQEYQDLGLWVLSSQEYPAPNANLVRTWDFEFWVVKNTAPPPDPRSVWRLAAVSATDTVSLV